MYMINIYCIRNIRRYVVMGSMHFENFYFENLYFVVWLKYF